MSKILENTRWALLGIVTLTFFGYGVLIVMGKMNTRFFAWGYDSWMIYAIGGIEVLAAAGLHWYKTKTWAMTILTVIAMGAILTLVGHHVKWLKDPLETPLAPIAILLCLFGIMYLNSKKSDSEKTK